MARVMSPGLVAALILPAGSAPERVHAVIEGYAWPVSVAPGDSVSLSVSTDAASFDVAVFRIGARDVLFWSGEDLAGVLQPVPDSSWAGCDWPAAARLEVAPDWPSGVYRARFAPDGLVAAASYALFTVVASEPGAGARILVQNSIATWQAYNAFGGRSLYDAQSVDGERAHVVSFRRPHLFRQGTGVFGYWEEPLIRWLEGAGFAVEYCTDLDTHSNAALLPAYDTFVVAGHDEYWSKEMRDRVESWNAAGGRLAIFGGNTCWWQIRYDPGGERIVCYKSPALDPLYGVDNERVTVRWHQWPLLRPANPLTGASLLHGGDVNEGTHAYRIHRPEHWAFAGTGLVQNDEFGGAQLVVDNEADGADLEWMAGVPVPTGSDGTPPSFTILATSPASQGWATLGVIEDSGRGEVFNAASITWSLGLAANDAVRRITTNVLERFAPGNAYAPRDGGLAVDDVGWTSAGSDVLFRIVMRNDSESQTSRFATVALEAFPLGGSAGSARAAGSLQMTPLLPQESVTMTLRTPRAALPPSAALHVAGSTDPVPGCWTADDWRGQLALAWRESGVAESSRDVVSTVDLPVCRGAEPSAVALRVDIPPSTDAPWHFEGVPPGWHAALRHDEAGTPGIAAANPLPPGTFAGWVELGVDGVVSPGAATVLWRWLAGADSGQVEIRATTCPCDDPTGAAVAARDMSEPDLRVTGSNPVRGSLQLSYRTPRAAAVRLAVYDVTGRLIRVLREGAHEPGVYSASCPVGRGAGELAPGRIVLVRLDAGWRPVTRKVVLLR